MKLKIYVKRYMTLYDFIKQIKKGKYDNTTEFIFENKKYDIDTYFNSFHCNYLTLNSEIEILEGKSE